jgi:hypothetical protein
MLEENKEEIIDDTTEEEEEEVEETGEVSEDKHELSKDEYEEYQKLKTKEFNFNQLRKGTKTEKEEIKRAKEDLNKEWQEFRGNLEKERKEDALSLLVGGDEELRKKALYNYERIKDEAKTKDEIYRKMKDAVNMLGGGDAPSLMAMNNSYSGYRSFSEKRSEKLKPEQEDLAKELGFNFIKDKNYGK